MDSWVIVLGQRRDLAARDVQHVVISTEDYVTRPFMFAGARQKVINLARSYNYQTEGYYCSLLAEARGHRVLPSVETILDLRSRSHYVHALPELEECLNQNARHVGEDMPKSLFVAFGRTDDARFAAFGQLLFDWFRAPALTVTLKPGEWHRIQKIELTPLGKFKAEQKTLFSDALKTYTARKWRAPKARNAPRYSVAVLYDPKEQLPPSSPETLRHWAKLAAPFGVEVEPIAKKDLARLAEFDALFIRETTSIRNHTYRFARRAAQEGMPVIDDPVSMIRCTNKVYLWERLTHAGLPVPDTIVIQEDGDLAQVADQLAFPVVVKIPDGSFSRGVRKADSMAELKAIVSEFFKETDVLLAQKFVPTQFDWRVGVLSGQPLFVCQYRMAKRHWQIVHHRADGTAEEGRFRTFPLDRVPPEVLDAGVRAASLIGDGLYGVDLKETQNGVYIIEINDNPNLEHGVEDQVGKADVWNRLTRWFTSRIDR
ncbi:RimK family protein [Faunimonas sp. B44]|uniref:RimK family protein n=1 Tax=Faunimonas sp. B44 TaxID=3461493 RepID=UPI004044B4B8